MNPFFHTDFNISDSLKTVRKSVLIYETIIKSQGWTKNYVAEIKLKRHNIPLPKDYEDSNKLLSQGILLYNQIFYKEEV